MSIVAGGDTNCMGGQQPTAEAGRRHQLRAAAKQRWEARRVRLIITEIAVAKAGGKSLGLLAQVFEA